MAPQTRAQAAQADDRPQHAADQRQACIHFLNGACRFGDRCRFAHAAAGARPQCVYFARGFCSRGDACMYAHGRDAAVRPAVPPAAPTRAAHTAAPPPQRTQQQRTQQQIRQQQQQRQPRQRQQPRQAQVCPAPSQQAQQQCQAGRQLSVFRDPTPAELEALYGGGIDADYISSDGCDVDSAGLPIDTEDEEEEEEEQETAGGAAAGRESAQQRAERRAARVVRYMERMRLGEESDRLMEEDIANKGRYVTEEFKALCWCEPCRRVFAAPDGLLSHCRNAHAGDERIAALQEQRACPCGATCDSFNALTKHIKQAHGGETRGQRQADAMLSSLLSRGFGGRGGGWDSDGDEGGMLGFTGEEVDELMCQGVKPWDDDAWDVVGALYDDGYY